MEWYLLSIVKTVDLNIVYKYIYLMYKVILGEVYSMFEVLSNTNDVQKSKTFMW